MIPGLNTEVHRRGRAIHIQTEANDGDSIQLTTHVFVGGTVIHTVHISLSGTEIDDVTARMRLQHREVHIRAEKGDLDAKLLVSGHRRSMDIPLAHPRSSSNDSAGE